LLDIFFFFFIGFYHEFKLNQIATAFEYYIKAQGFSDDYKELKTLAILHKKEKKYVLAELYYLLFKIKLPRGTVS